MTAAALEKLRFPIGRFQFDATDFATQKANRIQTLETLPQQMRTIVAQLSETDLNTPYRPGGWTGRQVVHHVVDSHLNAYIRFKWALTEDNPTIKAYNEAAWAELSDYTDTPVEVSLALLENLHRRWTILLHKLTDEAWNRTLSHPEWSNDLSLKFMLALYDWHSRHHLGHLMLLKH